MTVRVDLVGAKPPVWRRLDLPSTLRLDELHGVLQAVFGWTDSHLHRFSLGDSAWDDRSERFLCPYDVEEGEDDGVPSCEVRLDEVLTQPGDHLLYTYDYGDEWNHRLVVEQIRGPVEAVQCTDGRGAAPPEDSGGIWDTSLSGSPGRPTDAFTRTATALVLLAAAGGRVDTEQLAAVLTAAGWSGRGGTGVHRYGVRGAAGHVDEVLDLVGAYEVPGSVTPAGRVPAGAALRSR